MNGIKLQSSIFTFLCMAILPLTWNILPVHTTIIRFLFTPFITWLSTFLGVKSSLADFSSDSVWLYLLVFILLIFSMFCAVFLNRLKYKLRIDQFQNFVRIGAVYFLALILLKYGFDKLFKAQFYLPEPNLLYTPLGQLDKDILFWSTMGSSHAYNLFMGFAELVPAILLFFKRTREIGLIISFGVLLNVFAVNLSFDISVKLLAGFLLFLNLFLLLPTFQILWKIFILKTAIPAKNINSSNLDFSGKKLLKSILITLFFLESTFPYLRTLNFNDDTASRPYLHGAYEVNKIKLNEKPLQTSAFPFKRIFIHRDGYLIFQDQQEEMTDYKLVIDSQKRKMFITDYHGITRKIAYNYINEKKTLTFHFVEQTNSISVEAEMLNWRELPLLQNTFHWSVD